MLGAILSGVTTLLLDLFEVSDKLKARWSARRSHPEARAPWWELPLVMLLASAFGLVLGVIPLAAAWLLAPSVDRLVAYGFGATVSAVLLAWALRRRAALLAAPALLAIPILGREFPDIVAYVFALTCVVWFAWSMEPNDRDSHPGGMDT